MGVCGVAPTGRSTFLLCGDRGEERHRLTSVPALPELVLWGSRSGVGEQFWIPEERKSREG
jgi:hypothetical protein